MGRMDDTFPEPPFTVTGRRWLSNDHLEQRPSWESIIVKNADGDVLVEATTTFPWCPEGSGEDDRCDDPTWEPPEVMTEEPLTLERRICACQIWSSATMDDLVNAITRLPLWADMQAAGWTRSELDRCAYMEVENVR